MRESSEDADDIVASVDYIAAANEEPAMFQVL
jgi:hypothetical protein